MSTALLYDLLSQVVDHASHASSTGIACSPRCAKEVFGFALCLAWTELFLAELLNWPRPRFKLNSYSLMIASRISDQ